ATSANPLAELARHLTSLLQGELAEPAERDPKPMRSNSSATGGSHTVAVHEIERPDAVLRDPDRKPWYLTIPFLAPAPRRLLQLSNSESRKRHDQAPPCLPVNGDDLRVA